MKSIKIHKLQFNRYLYQTNYDTKKNIKFVYFFMKRFDLI